MADVVGIIGSVVSILTAAEVAYSKIKSMKGLPEAFAEVALRVLLAEQILSEIESRSRDAPESTIRVLLPVINSCKGNAEALKTTLEKLNPGDSTTAWSLDKYISLIKSRGKKGRVEDLMKKILQDIYTLASHKTINAATSEQLNELKEAMELVGKAEKSAPDEMLEEFGSVSISHGGQGPMFNQVGDYNTTWNNLGPGHINNINGNAQFGSTPGQKRREALRQLDCASYEDHKNRNPEAMTNTCEWFTEHSTYQNWMISLDESFLWVSADPGCGKSVLARYLIDHALKTSKVIYFFFKDGLDDQDNVESALKCLLHQLLKDNPYLFTEDVLELFEELGEKRSGGFSSLWNIFAKVSHDIVATTICVLDALDECKAAGWSTLAKALGDLHKSGKTAMRFILFSRPYNQIRRTIRNGQMPHINLRGEGEAEIHKISAEINFVVRQRVEHLVRESKLNFKEQEQVVQRLTKVRNRTYLWVHVICDMLENLERVENNSLEGFLDRLPETVEDAYEKILRQSTDVQTAKTLLHIIVAAVRPLSVEEMAMAMAVNGQQSFNGEFSIMRTEAFAEGMRNICGLFVVVIHGNVHLMHQTAREFLIRDTPSGRGLEWEACLNLQESNRVITRICVWYLLNIGSQSPPLPRLEDTTALDDEAQKLILFDYASRYWASHYRQSKLEENSDLGCDIFQLCDTSWTGWTTWYNHFLKHNGASPLNNQALTPHFSPKSIQLASYLGIDHAVKRILVESNYNLHVKIDRERLSPLYMAAYSGSYNVVIMLLETIKKYQVYHKRINIGPALTISSKHGHESIVEALLQASGTKLRRKSAQEALLAAAERGHDPIIRLILSSKPCSVLWRNLWFEITRYSPLATRYSVLVCAAMHGHPKTVKTILDSGKIRPNDKDSLWDGQTPLSIAAYHGHANIVRMLLETGQVRINSRDDDGRTPLSHAAGNGFENTAKMLLDTGQVDIESRDKYGRTPLSHAAWNGRANVARMLLETGQVDVDLRDYEGNTPLLLAAGSGECEVIEMLLATGKVDNNARNTAHVTPVVAALMLPCLRAASLLLASGNIHENQLRPERILFAAAKDDLSTFMPLYEEWYAEPRKTSGKPLQEHSIIVSFENGSKDVLEYLLDTGNLDINREFNWGYSRSEMRRSTLLVKAVEAGQLDVISFLLSRKANAHAKSSTDGATALSIAVAMSQPDIVKVLLQVEKLDLSLICENGLTTRLIARVSYDQFPYMEAKREVVVLLNDYIRAMPDGGKALRNLERRIINKKRTELRNLGMNFDDSNAES